MTPSAKEYIYEVTSQLKNNKAPDGDQMVAEVKYSSSLVSKRSRSSTSSYRECEKRTHRVQQ